MYVGLHIQEKNNKMKHIENTCYWHEWAKNKVKILDKEEILQDDDIIDCYRCKDTKKCPSYLFNLGGKK